MKTFSYLSVYLRGDLKQRNTVTAGWFDDDGVRYSVPVTSDRPGFELSANVTYSLPANSNKTVWIELGGSPSFGHSIGFQAKGVQQALDMDNFSYAGFMKGFWGEDEEGTFFYSGKSGFERSVTDVFSFHGNVSVTYKPEHLNLQAGYTPDLQFSRYSLDSKANANYRTHIFWTNIKYVTSNGWKFGNLFQYSLNKGYSSGYNDPQYIWHISISKDIKSVTIGLNVYDILNSEKYLTRSVSDNYITDSYHLVMGRYAMLSVKVNFGKLNESHLYKAQRAAFDLQK